MLLIKYPADVQALELSGYFIFERYWKFVYLCFPKIENYVIRPPSRPHTIFNP